MSPSFLFGAAMLASAAAPPVKGKTPTTTTTTRPELFSREKKNPLLVVGLAAPLREAISPDKLIFPIFGAR